MKNHLAVFHTQILIINNYKFAKKKKRLYIYTEYSL